MDASQMAQDAMYYVKGVSPILLIVGGVSFADILIHFVIKIIKQARGNIKW